LKPGIICASGLMSHIIGEYAPAAFFCSFTKNDFSATSNMLVSNKFPFSKYRFVVPPDLPLDFKFSFFP